MPGFCDDAGLFTHVIAMQGNYNRNRSATTTADSPAFANRCTSVGTRTISFLVYSRRTEL